MTDMEVYPQGPGWSGTATSKEAAQAIAHRCSPLRRKAVEALLHGPKTADEVAQYHRGDRDSYQPRLSELRALGVIEPSGERRLSAMGRPAIVWRVIPERIPPAIDPRITPTPDGRQ